MFRMARGWRANALYEHTCTHVHKHQYRAWDMRCQRNFSRCAGTQTACGPQGLLDGLATCCAAWLRRCCAWNTPFHLGSADPSKEQPFGRKGRTRASSSTYPRIRLVDRCAAPISTRKAIARKACADQKGGTRAEGRSTKRCDVVLTRAGTRREQQDDGVLLGARAAWEGGVGVVTIN